MPFSLWAILIVAAFAGPADNASIEGYVLSVDNEAIVLESGNSDVRVPRKFYAAKTKVGEKLSILMTEEDLAKVLKTAKASKLRTSKK